MVREGVLHEVSLEMRSELRGAGDGRREPRREVVAASAVAVRYEGEPPVLTDVSLSVRRRTCRLSVQFRGLLRRSVLCSGLEITALGAQRARWGR